MQFISLPLLQASGLDAALGSSEERTSRTSGTVSERESVTDNALRQEQQQGFELCSKAGCCGLKFAKPCQHIDITLEKFQVDNFNESGDRTFFAAFSDLLGKSSVIWKGGN